ncbi:outer membrane protein assembly factor BamA [Roseobacter sp. HKCCA0434]|uniref:outer membrane protein assembly factor BamA n=1 Tax=Roseobacter sp. HKCCA0434 TaxID=3079297 RepID=UPI002905F35F|nr:outer membrane protein assembly factor BamA [Roseobacter sp. HKCCA0434]
MTGLRALSASIGSSALRTTLMACVASAALSTGAMAQQVPGSFTLGAVTVEGNRRIEAETVRVYTDLDVGETVTPATLNNAVQALFATGLFQDAQILVEGNAVRIVVVENPSINLIAFEGNDIVSDELLEQTVEIRPRLAYNRAAVEADAARIIDAYRGVGRFDAQVNPVIIERPENRVDVVFEIFEGDVTEIERITFVGNQVFGDGELRDVIVSRQAGILSTFFSNDTFDPGRVRLDEELLRQFYLENGFAEFEVESSVVELSPDRRGFFLTYTINEGPRYDFGFVDIDPQIAGLDVADLDGTLTFEAGDGFDQSEIDATIENIRERTGLLGFAFADVVPRVRQNTEERTVEVTFEIVDGERVFVERIDISGNTSTLDRVIRREFDLVEGDAFNAASVRETADRLRGTGFFSDVSVEVVEGSAPDRAVIETVVEEQLTGSVNFGVAYSSASGVGGSIALSERNFLGRGQAVAVEFSTGSDQQVYSFSFEEPRFLDREVAAGFDLYYREVDRETSDFNEASLGFEPRVTFPLSDNGTLQLRYRLSSDEIDPNNLANTSPAILADAGEDITSSIGFTYRYDQRNSRAAPTRGYVLTFTGDLAGLGGDAQYLRGTATGRVYKSFRNDDVVTFVEGEVGALASADDGSRITDRFFLGGASFRGFQSGGFGPRDRDTSGATNVDSALGGNYYAVVRAQASFPLGLPEEAGLFGGVFANAGSLWGLNETNFTGPAPRGAYTIDDSAELRATLGVSLFWDSPIGALRIDYAEPVVSVDGDDFEKFRLSGGRRF